MKLERIIQTLIALLLAVFVYVIFDSFHEKLVVVGDSAPDFSITTDNGRTVTPANFGGKPIRYDNINASEIRVGVRYLIN